MTRKERFVLWLNKLGRGCNRITIIVLYITIMIILGTLIYGANQQRATSNITVNYSRPSYTINFDPAGGGVSLSSKTVKLGDNYGDLPIPTREGYEFAGWSIKEELDEQKNLLHGFTGSNFIALGRDKMYEDKITIIVKASMDNWADFSTKNMTLISCANGGGWDIDSTKSENINFWIYDKGVGYKTIYTTLKASSLSSGEHTFMGTFDGQYARFYVDGVLIGTSAQFSSGKIGYNSTNGIFIGAEAGDSLTTPDGYYFTGTISYVSIENTVRQASLISPTTFTGSNFIALGRDYMYEDKITIMVKASMDNWADFYAKSMILISCAEAGGWAICAEQGYLRMYIHDKGMGYKIIDASIDPASLSSGEHTFVGAFDGQYAKLYVDDMLVGKSAQFSSGKIGYNSTNGIFIGAEAEDSLTTPGGYYFTGTISYVSIENTVRQSANEPTSLITPTTFTGSNFIALGRDYMYENRITINIRASMDNWSNFFAQSMTLISCTEVGGWSICAEQGYLRMYIRDNGVGYKIIEASIDPASLSSGEHTFVGVFDGQYAKLYVDDMLVGKSAQFSSGKIGYHSSNGIFVGAEASDNTTTPYTYYFCGVISYVSIVDAYIEPPVISARTLFEGNDYMTLGREHMYEDKITITVKASMPNWSEVYLQKMTLISCTENGGWSIVPEDKSGFCDYITFWMRDNGVTYINAYTTIKWSSLSSGEHTFMGTFDGQYARIYLDDVLIGTSDKFSSGKIGYHSSNGIFVGAEAGESSIVPDTKNYNLFTGTISYVSIENTVRQPIIVTSTTQKTTMEDQTLTALWRVAQ